MITHYTHTYMYAGQRPLCPTHFIAIVIMTDGKLAPKQLAHGCTYAPGNTRFPAEDHVLSVPK